MTQETIDKKGFRVNIGTLALLFWAIIWAFGYINNFENRILIVENWKENCKNTILEKQEILRTNIKNNKEDISEIKDDLKEIKADVKTLLRK